MHALLGEEYDAFATALSEEPPVSVRLNPQKSLVDSQLRREHPVPWCSEGWYLAERPNFTLDPSFHAGAYYVQEASSMFMGEVLRHSLDLDQPLLVLDMCAAPGGKTTLLQSVLHPDSIVVANEVVRSRLKALRENIEKWGHPYVAITSAANDEWEKLGAWFDLVVVDAPCSGEGLFRKMPEALRDWSPSHVEACALRQRAILNAAVRLLRPAGVLIYSTCTFNRAENEDNVKWLISTFDLEPILLDLPAAWGIVQTMPGTYRFFPHRLKGEGFFLAALRKSMGAPTLPPFRPPAAFRRLEPAARRQETSLRAWLEQGREWAFFVAPKGDILAIPSAHVPFMRVLDHSLTNKWLGLRLGRFKGGDFVPDHALALNWMLSSQVPSVEFDREQALLFLKKEQFSADILLEHRGWVVARFNGLALGWLKALPNRWNNHLPQERRIRMSLDAYL